VLMHCIVQYRESGLLGTPAVPLVQCNYLQCCKRTYLTARLRVNQQLDAARHGILILLLLPSALLHFVPANQERTVAYVDSS
jgi:hypothetical protein